MIRSVIVRDVRLTGFDAPCCHTMYVGKPMSAIARVNGVFTRNPSQARV